MTVKELKKALRGMPDDTPVHVMFDPDDNKAVEVNAHAYNVKRAEYSPHCAISNPAFLILTGEGFWY